MAIDNFLELCNHFTRLPPAEREWDDPDTSGEAVCDSCDGRCPCRHIMIQPREFIVEMDGMGFWVDKPPVFKWWCRPCWEERTKR